MIPILFVLGLIVWCYVWSRMFAKMGYDRWWGLVMVVPLVNVVVLVLLAFSEWPLEAEARRLHS